MCITHAFNFHFICNNRQVRINQLQASKICINSSRVNELGIILDESSIWQIKYIPQLYTKCNKSIFSLIIEFDMAPCKQSLENSLEIFIDIDPSIDPAISDLPFLLLLLSSTLTFHFRLILFSLRYRKMTLNQIRYDSLFLFLFLSISLSVSRALFSPLTLFLFL